MGIPLIGVSKTIQRIRELIEHVADTGLNIVISGESGVGKEVIAQNLCEKSPRKDKPFVKVNCAALPEGLLESELFGYERGAFTGAEQRRRGKFELAHGGILFLDEIGDMPLLLQSKLLHVLQSGEFSPLGSEKDMKTDTWIIAATNRDLEVDINEKRFREDLYYRLNIIKIKIPPLRRRPEDIPPLIDHYSKLYSQQFDGKKIIKPSEEVLHKLLSYHWPGNVRELQNVLKRFIVINDWDEIIHELYSKQISENDEPASPASIPQGHSVITELIASNKNNATKVSSFSLKKIKKQAIDRIEREVISYVLKQTGWNRTKASKILKISYKTLLYKISDLGIEPPDESEEDFL
jgi:DNA-binding NtrC family response regulator